MTAERVIKHLLKGISDGRDVKKYEEYIISHFDDALSCINFCKIPFYYIIRFVSELPSIKYETLRNLMLYLIPKVGPKSAEILFSVSCPELSTDEAKSILSLICCDFTKALLGKRSSSHRDDSNTEATHSKQLDNIRKRYEEFKRENTQIDNEFNQQMKNIDKKGGPGSHSGKRKSNFDGFSSPLIEKNPMIVSLPRKVDSGSDSGDESGSEEAVKKRENRKESAPSRIKKQTSTNSTAPEKRRHSLVKKGAKSQVERPPSVRRRISMFQNNQNREKESIKRFSDEDDYNDMDAEDGEAVNKKIEKLSRASKVVTEMPENFEPDMMQAVKKGDIDSVSYILYQDKEAANNRDKFGWTPLHWAASHGFIDICKILLDNGAKVDVKNNYGMTPIHKAQVSMHQNIVDLLWAHSGNE